MKNIFITIEKASDGYFWCHTDKEINGGIMLTGCGKTVTEAKNDLLACYKEARDDAMNNGQTFDNVEFTYTYDLVSFFNYFSFLNISEIAKRAGINPSLMRQYASGIKCAGEKTYARLAKCVDDITKDLAAANF